RRLRLGALRHLEPRIDLHPLRPRGVRPELPEVPRPAGARLPRPRADFGTATTGLLESRRMLSVGNEVGRLRRVLVHEPGPEVDNMVPSMMEELLFDDILYGDRAREEHGRIRRVFQILGIEAVDAEDLLEEVLRERAGRAFVLDSVLPPGNDALRERLA